MNRKEFIRTSGMAAASLALGTERSFLREWTDNKVKIGIIGTGLRGQDHLELLLKRPDVEVIAICDIDQRMLKMAGEIITKSGKKDQRFLPATTKAGKNSANCANLTR